MMLSTQLYASPKTSVTTRGIHTIPRSIRCGRLSRRARPYHQVRAFRIGSWSSYLDQNFQQEARRRQQTIQHRFAEALNRNLSWDKHFPLHIRHNGMKNFMCSAWRGQDSRRGGRWINVDELYATGREPQSNEQTKDKKDDCTQDLKEKSLYQWLDSHEKVAQAKARLFPGWSIRHSAAWASRAKSQSNHTSIEDITTSSTMYGSEGFRRRFQSQVQDEDSLDYIDPITNRRITKSPDQSADQPNKLRDTQQDTFDNYRSQSEKFQTPVVDQASVKTDSSVRASNDPNLRPSQQHEVSPRTTRPRHNLSVETQDPLLEYDEKCGFNSGRQYTAIPMDIDYSCPVQQGLMAFDKKVSDSLAKGKAKVSSSPDKATTQDGLEVYDKKAKYEGREIFGSAYDEPANVDPMKHNITQCQSTNSKADDRPTVVTSQEVAAEDPILKAKCDYEQSRLRKDQLRDQKADQLMESIRNYEKLVSAKNVKGLDVLRESSHPLLKAIEEYNRVKAAMRVDPHSEESSSEPLLDAIREYKASLMGARHDQLVGSSVRAEVIDPLLEAIREYEASVLQGGLKNYRRPSSDRTQQHLEKYDRKVDMYRRPTKFDDPTTMDGKPASTVHSHPTSSAEIHTAVNSDEAVSPKSTTVHGTPKSWAYLPERIRDLFAKDITLETEVEEVNFNDTHQSGVEEFRKRMTKRMAMEHDFDTTTAAAASSPLSADVLRNRSQGLIPELRELQNEASRLDSMIDAKIGDLETGEQATSSKLTGNYGRDFPEDFKASWITGTGTLTRKDNSGRELEDGVRNSELAFINGVGAGDAFSGHSSAVKVEPSLDRNVAAAAHSKLNRKEISDSKAIPIQGEGDLSGSVSAYAPAKKGESDTIKTHASNMSKQKAKNAIKAADRELIREVRSIYEDAYGIIDTKHRQVSPSSEVVVSEETSTVEEPQDKVQPTVYRILAYDPTMQSISTAETTSIVPDASGSLTPAEVLLRLSNPAKFFPHFEPLQREGYEIVSGSGDVLVFRKVRKAASSIAKEESVAKQEQDVKPIKSNVNPIDGMVRGPNPATGDFASPTGFVNYDMPRGSEPPFKSMIDVRREEPVFSGRRNWRGPGEEDGGKRKMGVAKTALIGAGWLAGCSYAIGVVSDYFKTGGSDGKGPIGF